MKIREFSIEEYAAVTDLWRRSDIKTSPGDGKQDIRHKLKRDSDLFLVVEEDSKIVGAAIGAWDGRRGWIYHLAVDPEHQRRRIASKMLQEIECRMMSKGVLKVNAMVFIWNHPSLALFESLGYRKQSDMVMVGKILPDNEQAKAKTSESNRKR